jgi:hypothetical protein
VALRPAGTTSLLMNFMVLVPFTPRFSPCAQLPISFDVDLIRRILYRNNVMSSLCFNDLPVSGQITALAISGMMLICPFFDGCTMTGVFDGTSGKENTRFACCKVSSNMSCYRLSGTELRLVMRCCVIGVTNLCGVVCSLRWEFGVI